ncbi:tail assembly chaperone [Streptomyces phage Picard]|uniref:Tail assembly chaperone n=1 Tax=Streptomyces phage Picard TaxID=1920311 RepID=A0A1J0MC91_9CAUD|nr:tail assembly chaperone [Streptomyces phage Picard]APD18546.1 tail assembly chaperone [Streptomyces phage Picard]
MIEHDDQALDVDQDVDDVADFDAFFAEQAQPRRGVSLRLFGRTYTLPSTLPALYMLQLHRLKNSTNPEDIHRLLAPLFGPDAVAHWSDNGMDDRQLGIVLMWATANLAAPGSLSMGQAAAEYDRREAAKGKSAGGDDPAEAEGPPEEAAGLWSAVVRHWNSVEADLRREYKITAADVARLTVREFVVLLGGLSSESRFARAWQATPRVVTDPDEIARLTGR